MSHAVSSIAHAVTNPVSLVGDTLGLGIGGAGGLTGGTLAGNVATGRPLGQGLQGALGGDAIGLGAGMGLSGLLGMIGSAGGPEELGLAGSGSFDMGAGGEQLAGPGMEAGGAGFGNLGLGGVGNAFGNALGGAGRMLGGMFGSGGQSIPGMGGIPGMGNAGGGPSLAGMAPGLAALAYARNQPGLDTSRLTNTYDAAAANAPLYTQAAIDPLKQSQAAGYGDILQSQGARGIRGSSFGDQDIASYLNTTGRGISDAGANAAQSALTTQGNIAGNLALLQNQAQQQKNQLYGRAFDVLGRGLQPTGGFGGNGAMGNGGGLQIPGMGGVGSMLGNLWNAPTAGTVGNQIPTNGMFAGGNPSQYFNEGGNIDPNTGFLMQDPTMGGLLGNF